MNQGDALEHNFSAIYSALMFPVFHLLPGSALPQVRARHSFCTMISPVVCKYLILFMSLFDLISWIDHSESHDQYLVQALQGICSLLRFGSHSWGEYMLWRTVCQDLCLSWKWCSESMALPTLEHYILIFFFFLLNCAANWGVGSIIIGLILFIYLF